MKMRLLCQLKVRLLFAVAFLYCSTQAWGAGVSWPSENDLAGTVFACGGGKSYGFTSSLKASLLNWRKGEAAATADAAVNSLSSVLNKIPVGSAESGIYKTYTKCILDSIMQIMGSQASEIDPETKYAFLARTPLDFIFECHWPGCPYNPSVDSEFRGATEQGLGDYHYDFNEYNNSTVFFNGSQCYRNQIMPVWNVRAKLVGELINKIYQCQFTDGSFKIFRNDFIEEWQKNFPVSQINVILLKYTAKLETVLRNCASATTNIPSHYINELTVHMRVIGGHVDVEPCTKDDFKARYPPVPHG